MASTIRDIISTGAGIGLDPTAAAASASTRTTPSTVSPDPSGAVATDQTTLSPLGGLLRSSLQKASTLSSFRSDRVVELKSAIANGSYQPDLSQVARAVAHALEGIGQ